MADDVLFSEWLNEQLQQKQWTQAQLARASGLRPSTINKLINSKTKRPSPGSCKSIANAFGLEEVTVLRAAKLSTVIPEFPEQFELNKAVAQLPDRDREEVLAFVRFKLEFNKKGSVNIK